MRVPLLDVSSRLPGRNTAGLLETISRYVRKRTENRAL
jgi:hypothetical protein